MKLMLSSCFTFALITKRVLRLCVIYLCILKLASSLHPSFLWYSWSVFLDVMTVTCNIGWMSHSWSNLAETEQQHEPCHWPVCRFCFVHVAECRVSTVWGWTVLAQWTMLHHTVLAVNARLLDSTLTLAPTMLIVTSRRGLIIAAICRVVVRRRFQQESRHFRLCRVDPTFPTVLLRSIYLVRKRKTCQKNGWLIWFWVIK